MRTLVLAMVALAAMDVHAASMFDSMTEEQKANYEIRVVEKTTGKTVGKMSRTDFKVVSVNSSATGVQKEVVTACYVPQPTVVEKVVVAPKKRNDVILSAGVGPTDLNKYWNGSALTVEQRRALVGGLTYCRDVLCGSAMTNETYQLGVKLSF
jgi:hypothetical protein